MLPRLHLETSSKPLRRLPLKTAANGSIRLAIAAAQGLFRDGIRSLLGLQPDIDVVAETDRIDGISSLIEGSRCDLLVLDFQLGGTRFLAHAGPPLRVPVVVVSAQDDLEAVSSAIEPRAVVFKSLGIGALLEAIRAVARGETWLPPGVQEPPAVHRSSAGCLTPREREVVYLVALGMRNAEVGRRLFISEKTVKAHLNSVFIKLGMRDRVELARYAIRAGIATADEHPEEVHDKIQP